MKLEHSFEIDAPLDVVWNHLIDIEKVAPCLPGAEVTESGGDGIYKGTFTVKIGPTTAAYNGTLELESVDDATHTATMHAKGTDKRGQGGATATIVNRLEASGDATCVYAETDLTITGRLARFGRGGMMQDVSNRLLRDFSECLQQKLATQAATAAETGAPPSAAADTAPTQAKPVKGVSLFFSVMFDRIRRLFRRR